MNEQVGSTMNTEQQTEPKAPRRNDIPPWERIAVDADTAAKMMNIEFTVFIERVDTGMYPPPEADGQWSVAKLRALHDPWSRIAVDAVTAHKMMQCGYSTFMKRVKAGIYPARCPDGKWNVQALRAIHEKSGNDQSD